MGLGKGASTAQSGCEGPGAGGGRAGLGALLDNGRVSIFSSSPESPDGSTFDCLVFASSSEQECEEIVGRIGKGRVYMAAATISHTVEHQEFCSGPPHAGSDLIPFDEVTKMKRYFDIFLVWVFF